MPVPSGGNQKRRSSVANEKEKAQRRVYVLPNELVDRIVAYQQEFGIQSEVEAVRKLLDEALKSRDNWRTIARRFKERLSETKVLTDIAKDVLMGHPLVTAIRLHGDSIEFTLKGGEQITIHDIGLVEAVDSQGDRMDFEPKKKTASTSSGGGFSRKLDDDDIPF
jgi:hypothetical protein